MGLHFRPTARRGSWASLSRYEVSERDAAGRRVRNPETGAEVFGPSTGHKVVVTEAPSRVRDHRPPGEVWVEIRPSARGLAFDLGNYPPTWVVPLR